MTSGDLAANLAVVRARMTDAARRAGRDPAGITLVAVTKTQPLQALAAARAAGLTDLGENRVQEAEAKIAGWTGPAVTWHLIGHLQTNKARRATRLFDLVHSVDSVALAAVLNDESRRLGKVLPVLLEVNVAGEAAKSGFADDESFWPAAEAIAAMPYLRAAGLMTVAPVVARPGDARPVFRRLRELRDQLARRCPEAGWRHLSMGMTDDYEVAIEEGATIVRLGRAIFGPVSDRRLASQNQPLSIAGVPDVASSCTRLPAQLTRPGTTLHMKGRDKPC